MRNDFVAEEISLKFITLFLMTEKFHIDLGLVGTVRKTERGQQTKFHFFVVETLRIFVQAIYGR